MASMRYTGVATSKAKNGKFKSAKKFLSLQVSSTTTNLSREMSGILQTQTMARKRKKVIAEIFTTETTYQEQIYTLINVFLEELKKTDLLPIEAINSIFSNIEGIQAINKELRSHMETLGVGDAFLAMAPFIKLYSTYANNFEHASRTLQEWERKSPDFVQFITRQEAKEECKGLNLRSLLITPVQRVPRYKMLLESLLNKTPRDYPDFTKLEEATEEIAKVAEHINENIRQHENFQKMLQIQKSFTGEGAPKILAPGRLFIKDGLLLKVCRRGSQERMFFLFSDILIYAKKSGSEKDQSTYSSQRVFPLKNCQLEQMFGSSDAAADAGSMFKITCADKTLFLYSKSKCEAVSWFKAIQDAIGTLKTCRASLKRVSRGPSAREKPRRTPLQRTAVLKSRILRTPKSTEKKTFEFDCLSPLIKDSLYPLRKEIKKKKQSSKADDKQPWVEKTPSLGNEDNGSVISQSESSFYEKTERNDVDEYEDEEDYDDDEYDDDYDDDDYDDNSEQDIEPKTPSGRIDTVNHSMIDREDTPSCSDSEDDDDEESVLKPPKKRKVTIDEKENQFDYLSPLPSKKTCILPRLLCGGVNRTPLSSSRPRK